MKGVQELAKRPYLRGSSGSGGWTIVAMTTKTKRLGHSQLHQDEGRFVRDLTEDDRVATQESSRRTRRVGATLRERMTEKPW